MPRRTGWALLLAANVICYCVLGFYQTTASAQRVTGGKPPFANSVQQRAEMISHLREIKELLREQNSLLRSGNLRVVVGEPEKR